MAMERISLVADNEGGFIARIAYWLSKRKWGKVLTPLRIVAHRPRILRAHGAMERAQDRMEYIEPELRSLVYTFVATRVGCPF